MIDFYLTLPQVEAVIGALQAVYQTEGLGFSEQEKEVMLEVAEYLSERGDEISFEE